MRTIPLCRLKNPRRFTKETGHDSSDQTNVRGECVSPLLSRNEACAWPLPFCYQDDSKPSFSLSHDVEIVVSKLIRAGRAVTWRAARKKRQLLRHPVYDASVIALFFRRKRTRHLETLLAGPLHTQAATTRATTRIPRVSKCAHSLDRIRRRQGKYVECISRRSAERNS